MLGKGPLINCDIDFGAARILMMERKHVEVDEIELEPIPVEDSDDEVPMSAVDSSDALEALLFSNADIQMRGSSLQKFPMPQQVRTQTRVPHLSAIPEESSVHERDFPTSTICSEKATPYPKRFGGDSQLAKSVEISIYHTNERSEQGAD